MIPEARTLTQEELEAFAPPSDLKRGLKVLLRRFQLLTFSNNTLGRRILKLRSVSSLSLSFRLAFILSQRSGYVRPSSALAT